MNEVRVKFGALLKAEREIKGIKLDDLAEQLKISKEYLEAIETGDESALPSELYTNLFTKSYAESLGIDYTRTMEAINDDMAEPLAEAKNGKPAKKEEETLKEADDEEPTKDSNLYKKLAYLFGGVLVIFIVFLGINKIFFSGSESNTNDSATASNEKTEKVAQAVSEEELAGFNWDNTKYAGNEKIKIRFLPKDQSWATVLADGDTVLYRTLNAGRIYEVEADYRLLVSVGIPSAVDIELNGNKVNLVDPESRRISRVDINQMNLQSFLTNSGGTSSVPTQKDTETENTGASDES